MSRRITIIGEIFFEILILLLCLPCKYTAISFPFLARIYKINDYWKKNKTKQYMIQRKRQDWICLKIIPNFLISHFSRSLIWKFYCRARTLTLLNRVFVLSVFVLTAWNSDKIYSTWNWPKFYFVLTEFSSYPCSY